MNDWHQNDFYPNYILIGNTGNVFLIYFFLAVLGLCYMGFSGCSEGATSIVVHGLLLEETSLVTEHKL